MTKAWGTGYSGDAKARFPNGDLHPVFIMVQRDPVIPEDGDLTTKGYDQDEDYEGGRGTFGMFLTTTSPRSTRSSRTAFSLLSLRSASLLTRRGWPATL